MKVGDLSPTQLNQLCVHNDIVQLFGSRWRSIMAFRAHLRLDDIISATWGDGRDSYTWADPPDFWNESTLDECVEWNYSPITMELRVTMAESDIGGPVFGGRLRRWTFKIDVLRHAVLYRLFAESAEAQLKARAFFEFERREDARRKAETESIYLDFFKVLETDIDDPVRRRKTD